MWILKKPDLADAINDIQTVIDKSNGKLLNTDRIPITKIYKLYDKQNGIIQESQIDENLDSKKQNALDALYPKTRGEGDLSYIRKELTKYIYTCPICGFGSLEQLDHLYPQSNFPALGVCRLNLIPECGTCNNLKSNEEPLKFLHPYYNERLKSIEFFSVKIHSHEGILSWIFQIDETVLTVEELTKISFQISKVNLINRLYKETNGALIELLLQNNFLNIDAFAETVKNKYNEFLNSRGLNDWKTAFYKGLKKAIEDGKITMKAIDIYKKRNFEVFF